MAKTKKPAAKEAEKFPRKTVPLYLNPGDSEKEAGRKFARLLTSPELAAYRILNASEQQSGYGEHLDVPTLLKSLRDQATAVNGGDLAQAEAMLMNQATALQTLFARLTEKGMSQTYMPNLEVFLRLALKAQSQCRATLETLSNIKNPPVVYARQANIAHNQQVNNGEPARAREIQNPPNELLTAQHGETLDTFGTGAASGTDPALEAVGMLNRA